MLKQHNIFESIFIICATVCFLLTSVHCVTGFFGEWFPFYVVSLFVLSILFSLRSLQKLLELNTPIKCASILEHTSLKVLSLWIPVDNLFPKKDGKKIWNEYDTSQLSVISSVLERKLVSSWYSQLVSTDIGFPFACKELLDHAIGRAFNITHKIDTPSLYIDITSVLVGHLSEYKRAEKLVQISNDGTFEQHYRLMHPIHVQTGTKNIKKQSPDYCANILRVLLKALIPYDLWETPHSELLIRILTKRLDLFIKGSLSNPKWLRRKIIQALHDINKKIVNEDIKDNINGITNEIVNENLKEEEIIEPEKTSQLTIESALTEIANKTTAPILRNAIPENQEQAEEEIKIEEAVKSLEITETNPVEFNCSPVLRKRRGRQGNEIKIYDRIIEGSIQTWETDSDLRCISVGQDLLAGLNGEISLSQLWETDPQESADIWTPNRGHKSPPALWFGEDDAIDVELNDSPPKSANDEAAGMMEGILDLGMAGLRKGLQMTGLHEGEQDKQLTQTKDKSWNNRTTPLQDFPSTLQSGENDSTVSPALSEESDEPTCVNSTSAHLIKQHRVTSQDSVPLAIPGRREASEEVLGDSPEPQYEEAADFASSIAKLRSLLQEKSASDGCSEDGVKWESGDDRASEPPEHPNVRRTVDSAILADEYDAACENQPPGLASNNMQRLDRLLQRTVTGVLNSIKTAVGGEAGSTEGGSGEQTPPSGWRYVCTSHDVSRVGVGVARYLASRHARAVDTALDSLEMTNRNPTPPPPTSVHLPLDLEEWCLTCGGCWSGAAELGAAAGLWRARVTHTLATVLVGDLAENIIRAWLQELGPWLRAKVFTAFEEMAHEENSSDVVSDEDINVEDTVDAVLEKLPSMLWLFGESTLRETIRTALLSVASDKVNVDLAYRLVDVCALHVARVSAQ